MFQCYFGVTCSNVTLYFSKILGNHDIGVTCSNVTLLLFNIGSQLSIYIDFHVSSLIYQVIQELLYPLESSRGYFRVRYAAATHREIFDVNTLSGKLHQLGSPNLQDIFIGR